MPQTEAEVRQLVRQSFKGTTRILCHIVIVGNSKNRIRETDVRNIGDRVQEVHDHTKIKFKSYVYPCVWRDI